MGKIVVIGAGVAGLRAAMVLAKMRHDVIVLEARSRVGGRIYTIDSNEGHPIELGASFWEGTDENPFYNRYLKAHVKRLDPLQSLVFSMQKGPLDPNKILPLMIEAEQSIQNPIYRELVFSEMLEKILMQRPLDETEQYWLPKCVNHQLQHFNTTLDNRSFGSFTLEVSGSNLETWNQADASFSFVQNGYRKVTEKLLTECIDANVSILLEQAVLNITNTQSTVEIITADRIFVADKVISTIPIGVLKKEAARLFSPSLSKEKHEALAAMGVHQGVRISLEFEGKPFWGEKNGPYIYIDSHQNGLKEFRNYYPLQGRAMLLTDSYSQLESALADLTQAFRLKSLPRLKHSEVYHWGSDPYAQGAYPYRTPAMNEDRQRALEQPEGNIYFAGADFSRFGFSVHNAYAMGEKAAWEVDKTFKLR